MNSCDEHAIRALRYLDHDLEGRELEEFLLHLESCANCREYVRAEKKLTGILHRSRPLYSAPLALRDRVAMAVTHHPASSAAKDSTWRRTSRTLRNGLPGAIQRLATWQVLVPAAVAVALCLVIVPNIERRVQAASYVATAVANHRSYINGNLQQGVESRSPEEVAAWLRNKVPFDLRLPAAESAPGKNLVYRIKGATLVEYNGSPAALVTYETSNDKISLLIDSNKSAVVAGGDEVRFGNLTFHYFNDSNFRVITWNNHGLSYALVSSVSGPAHTSCLVCHQSMADSNDFADRQ